MCRAASAVWILKLSHECHRFNFLAIVFKHSRKIALFLHQTFRLEHLTVQHDCSSSATEVNWHIVAIQIRLLLLFSTPSAQLLLLLLLLITLILWYYQWRI